MFSAPFPGRRRASFPPERRDLTQPSRRERVLVERIKAHRDGRISAARDGARERFALPPRKLFRHTRGKRGYDARGAQE